MNEGGAYGGPARLTMATVEERLAVLEVKMAAQEGDLGEVKDDVKKLLALANRQKGGWAVIAAFSAVAGAVGGLVGLFAGKH